MSGWGSRSPLVAGTSTGSATVARCDKNGAIFLVLALLFFYEQVLILKISNDVQANSWIKTYIKTTIRVKFWMLKVQKIHFLTKQPSNRTENNLLFFTAPKGSLSYCTFNAQTSELKRIVNNEYLFPALAYPTLPSKTKRPHRWGYFYI